MNTFVGVHTVCFSALFTDCSCYTDLVHMPGCYTDLVHMPGCYTDLVHTPGWTFDRKLNVFSLFLSLISNLTLTLTLNHKTLSGKRNDVIFGKCPNTVLYCRGEITSTLLFNSISFSYINTKIDGRCSAAYIYTKI